MGVSLASTLDEYSQLLCCKQTDFGVQEQEIPGAYYFVETPRTRSSSEVPRQEACAFSIVVDFCASLLKANMCTRVCTQILLLPLTCVSRAVVFEPSWPLACIKQLVLFIF